MDPSPDSGVHSSLQGPLVPGQPDCYYMVPMSQTPQVLLGLVGACNGVTNLRPTWMEKASKMQSRFSFSGDEEECFWIGKLSFCEDECFRSFLVPRIQRAVQK